MDDYQRYAACEALCTILAEVSDDPQPWHAGLLSGAVDAAREVLGAEFGGTLPELAMKRRSRMLLEIKGDVPATRSELESVP